MWKQHIKSLIVPNKDLIYVMLMMLIFIVHSFSVSAQSDKRLQRIFVDATQALALDDYELAVDLGQKLISLEPSFVKAYLLLADVYHETGKVSSEIIHLKKAAGYSDMPLIQLRLGNALYSSGEYKDAMLSFNAYRKSGQVSRSFKVELERKIESCRFALEAIENPVEFNPERLPETINTGYDEYWPSLSIDQQQLVFTRLIEAPGLQPQEDFYTSFYDEEEGWSKAVPVNEINTPENEGAQALSANGNILFFTACNRKDGYGSCDIYYSIRRNGKWGQPVNAGTPLNSAYWEAQPSFSADGRFLYFTSNRPGGAGKRDIWRAECLGFDSNGRLMWVEPVNAGDSINTTGNETSPFIHAGNKDFYFASDYHTGMGGYDIFVSKLIDDTVYSAPSNLGYPINTYNDEQGLHIGADGLTAFFSSARDSLTGIDIYSFPVEESIRPQPATYARALVYDKETGKPLQAEIELQDTAEPLVEARNELTSQQGEILLCLPVGKNYAFSVSHTGYLFYSETFDLREVRQVYNPLILEIALVPIKVGAEMNLYNIYFEIDSFRILPESVPELNNLVDFLKGNSGLSVEIQGHTDGTGDEFRNLELSEKRARSVVSFLVDNGIRKEKLSWKGYGEAAPVADNGTEEGRRQNRRTVIKIMEDLEPGD